jgi:hypothetical protein
MAPHRRGEIGGNPLHHAPATIEGRGPPGVASSGVGLEVTLVAGCVAHRAAVVEDHQVRRRVAARNAACRSPTRLRKRGDEPEHRQRPQGEQRDLTEQHAGAVAPLARQQKLHRRPLHPPLPQQVDEVDQHGRRNERQAPPEERREVERWHARRLRLNSHTRPPR